MMMYRRPSNCKSKRCGNDIWVVVCVAVPVLLLQCSIAIEASVASRGEVYMLTNPSAVAMPINDETLLSCEMNIAADKFEWRHYPLPLHEAANPLFPLSLGRAHYVSISPSTYVNNLNSSTLTVKSVNASVAGDYQCLAHYGASVVASTPGRVTITALRDFAPQDSVAVTVTEGNTIVWACRPPASNPPAYIDFYRNGKQLPLLRGGHPAPPLVLERVRISGERDDRGMYMCKASNVIQKSQRDAPFTLTLNIVPARNAAKEAPRFITPMKNVYDVKQGSDVFLECAAVGNPVPNVTWRRLNGSLPAIRAAPVPGGIKISNVTSTDDDVYICEQRNERGFITAHIKLNYQEAPVVVQGPRDTQTKEGDDLHLECIVTGSPTPEISWLWNGVSVLRDSQIEAVGNKIYFTPVEKRHAGKVQCFAANVVGIDYGTSNLNVIPKQYISTIESVTPPPTRGKLRFGHRKTQQMTPPTRPIVTRLTDESVMVRWDVPKNPGLEIEFFKIQYRLRTNNTNNKVSKWETTNVDIPQNQKCYEVGGLIPNNSYQFRVGAVYTNKDNKFGQKSAKFFLEQMDFDVKNTLPIPILINTEPINSTSIKVYWEKPPSNVTVEGYIINYMSASSAGDYNKVTVDGDSTSFIVTHLDPDTMYDIKMQSFTTKSGSEFSPIMKNKTAARIVAPVPTTVTSTTTPATTEEPGEMSKIFILVGVGVVVLAVLLTIVIFVIICHKWKRKKNANNSRAVVDEINHRIPADANDYVMSPKTNVRTNGSCGLPSNRITITANPLADADNKSPTMMLEMACLTSQNNNCTAALSTSVATTSVTDSAVNSRQQNSSDGGIAYGGHHSKHKRRKRTSSGTESSPMAPSENYV